MIRLSSSSEDVLCKKLVVVDGIPGCGKTMLSSIVASLSNIEMLKYSYEIENYCHLYDMQLMDMDTAAQLIKNQFNLILYNGMMGREMNFRYSDISSVFQSLHPAKNIRRIFGPGDEAVPGKIQKQAPVLHLATHGLCGISKPFFQAMPEGMLFLNMVRHPLFLLKQNLWNMSNLINNQRSFWLYYRSGERSYPYFYYGKEELFEKASPKEKAIYFIQSFVEKEKINANVKDNQGFYELSFESLVREPEKHILEICKRLNITKTRHTDRVLRKENIPRTILSHGRNRKIYKRVGWIKSGTTNQKDEFAELRAWALEGISAHAAETLLQMCEEYEKGEGMRALSERQ